MKVIIAGCRDYTPDKNDGRLIAEILLGLGATEVVSGNARGVDAYGELVANYMQLKLTKYPAQWDLYGKYAGFKRNQVMANYSDALIAIWDGKSRGTNDMITRALRDELDVHVLKIV